MHNTLLILGDQQHFLVLPFTHRDHQAPPPLQLVHQRRRNEGCTAGDKDAIERGFHRQSREAVAVHRGGAVPQQDQACLRLQVERTVAFYGEDPRTQFHQHRRLVAAAGADLKHLHSLGHLQKLALESHRPGLGDGLAARYREGRILIGSVDECGVIDEPVARHRADGG